jgi:hypothetical protein
VLLSEPSGRCHRSLTEVHLADLGDAGDVVRYLVGFWAFLFSPKYRTGALHRWHHASPGTRSLMVIEGLIATIVGVGIPLLVAWIFSQEFLAG